MLSRNTSSEIELSIVITVVGGKQCVHRCLSAICPQVSFATMEVIVPHDRWSSEIEDLAEEFSLVQFPFVKELGAASSDSVSSHQHRLYDRRRAFGVSLARGSVVAMTEDYAVPAEDWCRKILETHTQPYAAIGGAIENAVDRPLNWALYYCDFGRYGRPLVSGPVEYASDVNIAYKREALESVRNVWCEAYREIMVNSTLRSNGEIVFLDPRMVVYENRPPITLGQALRERVEWGRIFAETRIYKTGLWGRLLYAAGTPMLPGLLLIRVLRHMLRQGRSLVQIAQTLPIAACLLAFWALGEFNGYVSDREAIKSSVAELRSRKLRSSQS